MVYVKSVIVGMLTVFIATVLSVVVMGIYLSASRKLEGEGAIGWDPIAFYKEPLSWFITAGAFLAGFVWEFRRAH